MLYARQVESPRPVRHTSWLGQTIPWEGSASGTALAGDVGPDRTVIRVAAVEDGTTAVAAPVRGPDGSVVAAAERRRPELRMGSEILPRVSDLVRSHADALEAALRAAPRPSDPEPS